MPAAWPHQVGVIPSRAQSFQHRAEADRLRAAIDGGGTAVLRQVLTGMGGVGKTQLAADYAHTAWDTGGLDVLVWITASARSPVVTGYAQASIELCRAVPDDPEQAARSFLAWLTPKSGQQPCRWLIVLDDVADPEDLRGLWPPASPHGRTLATTRRRDAALTGEGRRLVEVGLFTEAEAVAYLTTSLAAHGRVEPTDQLTALAADVGHLALALAQAAAYLIDSGETAAAYRDLLTDRATKLADLAPDALPDEQVVALAAAWSLSIARADQLRPAGLARPLLQLAALLDANGIPQDVLTGEVACAHLAAHRTATGPNPTADSAPVSRPDAVRALRALDRLSLIDHRPGAPHQAVRVHQLIQRASRDTLTPDQRDQYARTAADALMAAWPDIERDTALAQALRANTTALTTCAEDALYRPDAHPLLYRAGSSLGEAGQVTAATIYFHQLTTTADRHLGPDHPDTLITRHDLAHWQGRAGDAAGAMAAFAELLADRRRVLGDNHPHTLTTRSHLGQWRGETGDASGAAAAFAELLADRRRVLGNNHPHTLTTRSHLGQWRGETGDASGAAAAFAELLADRRRVLGNNHPDTLTTRGILGRWRGEAGDAAGAMAAFAELLADRRRVLGDNHPDTLTTRHELAWWRGETRDAPGAAAALAELLPDQQRVLGDDHPHTLITRHSLAWWRGEAGDAAGAAAALAELLADRRRVLGDDHPHTLSARHNLAHWRGRAGDAAGAAAALAELLPDQQRVLGDDHLHTLTTRHNLAHWRGQARNDTAAHQSTD
ncbi:FxSxx-COOH system tetratricopeptide repeat protein [Streptomyces herbicida]|uniref:FxSxx-COOH system tetratricopeptide repeat protein n=1 Tax=Streptomyces herbicida TaxID=3065675 RepID=UPI00293075FD|nr:FxSxx-COOH system tetratricopeptide repeat protein [Streptomyces sp. NEAU-HV9]